MTEPTEQSGDRIAVAMDRGTRIVRLLTWTAMFVLVCLMLWVVSGMVGEGGGPEGGRPRHRQCRGNAAAGAIARDAASAAEVPGYAGTDVPERNLTASGMEDAARARLADPDDPGGAAGRAVVRGTTAGPPSGRVTASDPMVRRSETVAASPQSSVHRADGLASGGATDCGAGLRDAQSGGSCGSVRYCVGAGCETVRPRGQHRLRRRDDAAQHGAGAGRRRVRPPGHALLQGPAPGLPHPFRAGQLLQELGRCWSGSPTARPRRRELAEERNAGNTHYLGRYCSKKTLFGICIRHSRAWCVFGSKLGRILQQQGRRQLGIGWSSCRGFTVAEIEGIDFASLDLSSSPRT